MGGGGNLRDQKGSGMWGVKEGRRGTKETLTHVILQAELEFGPEHDEGKGGVEVDIVCVIHAIFLTWKIEGDTVLPEFLLPLQVSHPTQLVLSNWVWGTVVLHLASYSSSQPINLPSCLVVRH